MQLVTSKNPMVRFRGLRMAAAVGRVPLTGKQEAQIQTLRPMEGPVVAVRHGRGSDQGHNDRL